MRHRSRFDSGATLRPSVEDKMKGWLAVALTPICTAVFGQGSERWISDAKLVDPVDQKQRFPVPSD
jgi:hypothetical protein